MHPFLGFQIIEFSKTVLRKVTFLDWVTDIYSEIKMCPISKYACKQSRSEEWSKILSCDLKVKMDEVQLAFPRSGSWSHFPAM